MLIGASAYHFRQGRTPRKLERPREERERVRKRERERDRQTDRQTGRQTGIEVALTRFGANQYGATIKRR